LEKAFEVLDSLGVTHILDPEDITGLPTPERLSTITYLNEIAKRLRYA
jgi:hypothetical protein